MPNRYIQRVSPEPGLANSPALASALVDAARHATVGVLVAVQTENGCRCEFVNDRMRALVGHPKQIPEDLELDAESRNHIASWLADPRAPTLALDAVSIATKEDGLLQIVASRSVVAGRRAVVFFFYDSVVRLRAERALAESEARFRRLLDAAPDAIALGTKTRFVYANPAGVRLLGYGSMQEVTSVPLREHIHPEDRPVAAGIVRALLTTGAQQNSARVRLRHKDGHLVYIDLRPIAIEWEGEPALLGIGRDLTERRRGQAQLIRADRLAAMGTLAAGVAHEINNPLAYLMLNLQYLMRELPRFDGDPARLELLLERLAEAEHGARRVSTIVGDLRTLSRAEQVGHAPVSVKEAAVASTKLVGVELRRRARLVEDYADVPRVVANATRLEQVFTNLLLNASQSIAEGRPQENEVRLSLRSEGNLVVAEVSDTGAGIPKEIIGRIFDPFFTTKPRGVGTGLGLPISRGIVKSFGGDITVTSTSRTGTTFRVELPALAATEVVSERVDDAAPSEAPIARRQRRARVLVVDDERLVADMLKRALSDANDVTVATDAQTALDQILSGAEFDLIFCDLLMPRMSGMDLYEKVRATRSGFEERIVFMTGGAFTDRAAQFLATVPNRTMSKPFNLIDLERIVSRAARGQFS